MHPSYAYAIAELKANAADILHECQEKANAQITGAKLDLMSKIRGGEIWVDQGLVAGCSGGTFDNVRGCGYSCAAIAAETANSKMSVYPHAGIYPADEERRAGRISPPRARSSANASAARASARATPRPTASFSIRHTTRKLPEPRGQQARRGADAGVALMDARSIAATAINGGRLTAAMDLDVDYTHPQYFFDGSVYEKRVYNGYGKAPSRSTSCAWGRNIKDWPGTAALSDDLLVKVVLHHRPGDDDDELIRPAKPLPTAPTRCVWRAEFGNARPCMFVLTKRK